MGTKRRASASPFTWYFDRADSPNRGRVIADLRVCALFSRPLSPPSGNFSFADNSRTVHDRELLFFASGSASVDASFGTPEKSRRPIGPELFTNVHLLAKCFSALACRPLGPGSIGGYHKTRLGETFHPVPRPTR